MNIIATYDYTDTEGALLYQVLRLEPKSFRQRRPDCEGGWVWSIEESLKTLYNLPAVVEARDSWDTIFLVEGEKDADTLTAMGLVATTNSGGSNNWSAVFADILQGAHVVVIPDNDKSGESLLQTILSSLYPTTASLKVLRLSGLPPKGDVTDWVEMGGNKQLLLNLVENTPTYEPEKPKTEAIGLPFDLEAEQLVLAAACVVPGALDTCRERIIADHFYRKPHSQIWRVIDLLETSGRPIDSIMVRQELRKFKEINEVDLEYAKGLFEIYPYADLDGCIDRVIDQYTRRKLELAGRDVIDMARNCAVEAAHALDKAQAAMMALTDKQSLSAKRRGFTEIHKTVWDSANNPIVAIANHGLTLGYTAFDDATDGLQPGDLGAVVGRSGIGKTGWVMSIADHVAFTLERNVLVFEGEMTAEALYLRCLCSRARVRRKDFKRGSLASYDLASAKRAAKDMYSDRIQVIDPSGFPAEGLTPAFIRQECRQMRRKQGLDLIIVDYLELMEAGKKVDNETQRLDYIIRQLKQITTQMNCAGLVLAQANRAVEGRENKRLTLSDIRGSGGIEAALDWAFSLYNQTYYDRKLNPDKYAHDPYGFNKEEVEINTIKSRNDASIAFKVGFIPGYTAFYDLGKQGGSVGDSF